MLWCTGPPPLLVTNTNALCPHGAGSGDYKLPSQTIAHTWISCMTACWVGVGASRSTFAFEYLCPPPPLPTLPPLHTPLGPPPQSRRHAIGPKTPLECPYQLYWYWCLAPACTHVHTYSKCFMQILATQTPLVPCPQGGAPPQPARHELPMLWCTPPPSLVNITALLRSIFTRCGFGRL